MTANNSKIDNTDIVKLNFAAAKILVVGDVMLDQYWHGGTSRISPEAPVPVVKINKTDHRPGGAANVAKNLVVLGCQVKLLGMVGLDNAADLLRQLLDSNHIQHELVGLDKYSTIVKLRVLCKHQQMIRLDHEEELKDLDLNNLKLIYDLYASELKNYNTVILSDYAKGVLINPRPFIDAANALGVTTIVDPKSTDFSLYSGATVVKPNLNEFEKVVGKCDTMEILEERARNLLQQYNIGALVITRGGDGMSVIPANKPATHLPACGGEVYDVTGAGDTVIAMLGAGLSSGLDLVKSAMLSTVGAGLVVSKVGTSSVSLQELKAALGKQKELPLGVTDEKTLREIIKVSQARGERVVFVNGCYDMLHFGHIRYLEQARALGDRLVVGVNSDASVQKLKGPGRPFYDENRRMEVLAGLKAVDWVVVFDETTPGRLVESLNPDIMAKGDEHFKSIEDIPNTEGVEHVLKNGGEVHLIKRTPDCSSTKMLEFMQETEE